MNRFFRRAVPAALIFFLIFQLPTFAFSEQGNVSDELIVEFEEGISREAAAQLIVDYLNLDEAEPSYTDVPSNSPYAGAIGALSEAGIMNGYGKELFGYGDSLSRSDAVVLNERIALYAQFSSLSASSVNGLTIDQIHYGISKGAFSCVQLIEAYTDRIEAYDQQGPALNAIINMNPNAQAQAAALDERRKAGEELGVAHCVPVVVKDNVNTVDMPTTNGSSLFENWIPGQNAAIIVALEEKGAIVLAKSNLDDFAAAVYGISSLRGEMKNPYDLERTVGGSSGGSAVAVAAQYAPLAIGTDTGGSLRIPAALTGVVTIRPTMGLVSQNGIFPRSFTQDTAGPLAANVKDAAFGLDLIAGYDPANPITSRGIGQIPSEGYASFAEGGSLEGVKIGLVTEGLSIWGDEPDGPVVKLLRQAAEDIEALGGEVIEVDGPPSDLLGSTSVIGFESAHDVNQFLDEQDNVPVTSFAELYESGQYSDYAKEPYDREIKIDPETLDENIGYQRSLALRTQLQDWTLDTMAKHGLSAIAYPSSAQLADLIGNEQAGLFTRWSENTGFPAISVPMGYAESDTGTMLPANIEFLGRAFGEPDIIRIASAYEAATERREVPQLPVIE